MSKESTTPPPNLPTQVLWVQNIINSEVNPFAKFVKGRLLQSITQTLKERKWNPKESPQKTSVRPTRTLKINPSGQNSPSSSTHAILRTSLDRSPKVAKRKSTRSPVPEKEQPINMLELEAEVSQLRENMKKMKDELISSMLSENDAQSDTKEQPINMLELEAEVSQLRENMKKMKDELISSMLSENDAQSDAKELRSQLVDVSEESQKQVCQLIASNESSHLELDKISTAKNQVLESENESRDEIQKLKLQLEMVTESHDEQRELTNSELKSLKEKLLETLSQAETMKYELEGSRESEALARELIREILLQLEAVKESVNSLRSDVSLSTEAYNCVKSELEQSRARASFLEDHVSKLNADIVKAKERSQNYPIASQNSRISEIVDVNELELELERTKFEVSQLKCALEASEIRNNEERSHNISKIKNASQLLEQIKAESSLREAKLEELKKAKAKVEELKANLMDKETELQGISEENDSLNLKLEKSISSLRELELENELKKLREDLSETMSELQTMSEENVKLKADKNVENDSLFTEIESSQAKEQEAMEKRGCLMEEVDKSTQKASRASEQPELAQTANAEMETRLRKLKVQLDQWRKGAEAAASILSPGSNEKFMERTGSLPLDNHSYSPIGGRISLPYLDDYEEDSYKKKNGGVLKKIRVLWKKPQKHGNECSKENRSHPTRMEVF